MGQLVDEAGWITIDQLIGGMHRVFWLRKRARERGDGGEGGKEREREGIGRIRVGNSAWRSCSIKKRSLKGLGDNSRDWD